MWGRKKLGRKKKSIKAKTKAPAVEWREEDI